MALTPGFKFLVQNSSNTSWTDASRGYAWVWGSNSTGDTNVYSSPVQIGALSTWKKIIIGTSVYPSFGIKNDGTLWTWGNGGGSVYIGGSGPFTVGLHGIGVNSASLAYSSPIQVGALTNWADVALAENGYVIRAVKTDGTLWGWGITQYSAFPATMKNLVSYASPVQLGALTNWQQISIYHGIKTDGTLWTIQGSNELGYLGNGTTVNYSSPIQIGSLNTWKQVSGTSAIRNDGTLWTWSDNTYGTLGIGNAVSYSSPVQVGSLTTWNSLAEFHGSADGPTRWAIKYDGTLWAWGYNGYGGVGNGSIVDYSSPVQIGSLNTWKRAITYAYKTFATKTDGTIWGWGYNGGGDLGVGNLVDRSSPTQIGSFSDWSTTYIRKYQKETYADLSDVLVPKDQFIDVGLYAWGNAASNGLGSTLTSAAITYSSPIAVGSLTSWKTVGSDINNTDFAIREDGTLWGWGYNGSGALGNGSTVSYSSPIQIGTLNNWKQVAHGCGSGAFVAVKNDGTMWGCGYTGDATYGTYYINTSYSSPVQVGALTNWAHVQGMGVAFHAIKTDGTLWAWGGNGGGQLGNSTTGTFYSSPIQIGALTDWQKLYICDDYSVNNSFGHGSAIKKNGTLWLWGNNQYGQLGNSTRTATSSPVQLGTGNWSWVAVGGGSTAAIKTDGTLWIWGQNVPFNVSDFTNGAPKYSSPIQIGALNNWKRVYLTATGGMALKTDGTAWAWGFCWNGIFGNVNLDYYQSFVSYSSPVQVAAGTLWREVAMSNTFAVGITL